MMRHFILFAPFIIISEHVVALQSPVNVGYMHAVARGQRLLPGGNKLEYGVFSLHCGRF